MSVDVEAARKGTAVVTEALGFKNLSATELEVIAEAVVGLVIVLGRSALERARSAGQAAADRVVTDADAKGVLGR